jgi:uncharacterized membrane protein
LQIEFLNLIFTSFKSFQMKNAILFSFLFFLQCFLPTTMLATTQLIESPHSTVISKKKLSLREKVNRLLTGEPPAKVGAKEILILIGAALILVGIILLGIADTKAATPSPYVPAGLKEGLSGSALLLLGIIVLIIGLLKKKKAPKQMP